MSSAVRSPVRRLPPVAPDTAARGPATSQGHPAFRPDVEGIRGLAILFVVLFHAGVPGFGGGFVGVDVFFVLSGYLITGLLVGEVERTGRLDLVRFYARRARRLLPAGLLVLVATLAVGAFVFAPSEQQTYARAARATAGYGTNVWLVLNTGDYFARESADNPFLHTWSLAVEEQFYVVWPLAIVLGLRLLRSRVRLAGMIAVLSALSLAACVYLTARAQPWAFFSSPTRAWEFGVGGLASLLPAAALHGRAAVGHVFAWLGFASVLAAGVLFTDVMSFPGVAAALPAVGTALLLVAGAAEVPTAVGRILTLGGMQRIGRLSYSWYLWHWPALVVGAALVPGIGVRGRLVCALVALGLSWLTYRYVENPVRTSRTLAARPGLSLALGPAFTVAGVVIGTFAARQSGRLAMTPRYRVMTAAQDDKSPTSRDCIAKLGDARVRECAFGDPRSATTVVLFGDSHADHWFPALERVAAARRWRLVTVMKSACPSAEVDVFNRRIKQVEAACGAWREQALRRVAAIRPSAVVVSNFRGAVRTVENPDGDARVSYARWQQGLRRTLVRLDALGVPVLLLRDTPKQAVDVPACLGRLARQGRTDTDVCTLAPSAALSPTLYAAEGAAAAGLPHVRLVDLSAAFCTVTACPPVRGNTVVYRDSHHITATYSRSLAPVFARAIVAPVEAGRGRAAGD